MRLSKQRPPGTLSFNITPMIDIVFLLIIFFMTVSQITRTVDTPLPLPRVTQGDEKTRTASLTINISQQGELIIGGQTLPLRQVVSRLQTQLARYDNDPTRLRIQLRIHRQCPSRFVTELLKELSQLGFTNVRSAVTD